MPWCDLADFIINWDKRQGLKVKEGEKGEVYSEIELKGIIPPAGTMEHQTVIRQIL